MKSISVHLARFKKFCFVISVGRVFHKKSRLARHMSSHIRKGYACNECGVKCSRPDTLKGHKTIGMLELWRARPFLE
jgi:hypothetical protein